MTTDDGLGRPQLPRAVAGLIIGAIAVASLAALVYPALGDRLRGTDRPTGVGVIRRDIEVPEAAGRIGAKAPDFEWNAPGGATKTLGDLRGKTVVINFWATWCVPCREEMPALEKAAMAAPDLTVLAVDLMEDGERVRGFFESLGLTRLQPLLDTNGSVARRYAVFSLPTTFFVGPDGVIRDVHVGGPMSAETIAAGIAKARVGAVPGY
ncbi:MAG: TlpA disulfide reductase family protein [Candidatus Limnocylindria bacterium]|nr:TlpA disulfide reductase family protein [Candidatus Limnocylindria bacterium]